MRWLPILAAVLGPTLVIGAAMAWWLREEPWTATGLVQAMDTSLIGAPPTVVVLGSSWAELNVDTGELARGLGLVAGGVTSLSQRNSYPPVWYAVLRYRLDQSPAKPRVILLVTSLPHLLVTRVDERSLPNLEQHYPSPDEVLLQKTYGSESSPLVRTLLARRGELRDGALAAVRGAAIQILRPDRGGRSVAELQDAAGAVVFGELQGHGDAITSRLLPVVEHEDAAAAGTTTAVEHAVDTYLPDLAALAAARDAHFVVVLTPVAEFQRSQESVTPALEREFIEYATAHDIGWADLRSFSMDASDFASDGRHMRPAGAKKFTAALAARLNEIGALGAGAMAPAVPAARIVRAERRGTPPTVTPKRVVPAATPCVWKVAFGDLQELTWSSLAMTLGGATVPVSARMDGLDLPQIPPARLAEPGCEPGFVFGGAGSAVRLPEGQNVSAVHFVLADELPDPDAGRPGTWWVYPGTELRIVVDAGPEAATLALVVRAVKGDPNGVEVEVDGVSSGLADGIPGLEASFAMNAARQHTLVVRSPPDGAWLVLRRLQVQGASRQTDLIAQQPHGRLDVFTGAVDAGPVPKLPAAPARDDHSFRVPWSNPTDCSPFLVLEDGAALPTAAVPQRVGVWHEGDRVYFRPRASPASTTPTYELAWDASRACASKSFVGAPTVRWLLPGDRQGWVVDQAARRKLRGGALRVLYLEGTPLPGGPGTTRIHVTASLADEVLADAQVDPADLPDGVTLALSRFVLAAEPGPMQVRIEAAPDAAPVRLSVIALPQ